MKILNLTQGSPEWHAARAQHFTASEAPVMMGASKYLTRSELLKQKATGLVPEVSERQQRLFDKGHATEALARPLVEAMIGDELFPATGVDGELLASFDGMTMLEDTLYEHKLWNEDLANQVRASELDPHYYWQLEQQLLVSGAERTIFVVSDGTRDHFEHLEYRPVPGRAEQLQAGWAQFKADLAAYAPAEAAPVVEGREVMALPALSVQLVGEVKSSNLALYQNTALAFIRAINTDLQTDQDFADAEKIVKFCDKAEKELDLTKQQALAQTASVDELFRTIDVLKAEMRSKRLELEKLVKSRKEAIRLEIQRTAEWSFLSHVDSLNARLGRVKLPTLRPDIAGAMKGKKTLATLRDAADTAVAKAKIEASTLAEQYERNLATLNELAGAHAFLFADVQQLVLKANDDLVALIKVRVGEHTQAEHQRRLAKDLPKQQQTTAEWARAIQDAPAAEEVVEQAAAPAGRRGGSSGRLVSNSPQYRPTDDEIISALSTCFKATTSVVREWLLGMDLAKADRFAKAS